MIPFVYMRTLFLSVAVVLVFAGPAVGQTIDPGRQVFEARCARCNGGDGTGGPMGPSVV